ncbi:hypothetical protein [uncultured Tenacibaculum sp.]|uniref:hypothetical protein n=1 Tax=uncultured Tenacibaculum sp. TaxID=174713 RepID=UPI002626A2FA|nr:hypothetical protein [uncultured Tenacibaculum sp.]
MIQKNVFLSFMVLTLFVVSCSNNEEQPESDNEPPISSKEKLISKITNHYYQDLHSSYKPDTLVYQNGRLVKAWFYGVSGTMYEFEYGSNDKIQVVYSRYNTPYNEIGNSIATENYKNRTCYYDASNKLIRQVFEDGREITIDYDSEDRATKIQGDISLIDNGLVTFSDFDTNGNPQKNSYNYAVSYDDKANPVYVLFKKFGFFNIEMGNSLDDKRAFYISPNNVTQSIRTSNNNENIFSSIYTYDSEGYPISSNYLIAVFPEPRTEIFEYLN